MLPTSLHHHAVTRGHSKKCVVYLDRHYIVWSFMSSNPNGRCNLSICSPEAAAFPELLHRHRPEVYARKQSALKEAPFRTGDRWEGHVGPGDGIRKSFTFRTASMNAIEANTETIRTTYVHAITIHSKTMVASTLIAKARLSELAFAAGSGMS